MAETGGEVGLRLVPRRRRAARALLGGHVDFVLLEPREAGELIRAGKLRALAQIADKTAARLRERADTAGSRLQRAERAAVARHRRPAQLPADAVAYYEDLLREDVAARRPGRSS